MKEYGKRVVIEYKKLGVACVNILNVGLVSVNKVSFPLGFLTELTYEPNWEQLKGLLSRLTEK